MRRGTRRGQSTADELRIVIRNNVAPGIPSPESSPDSPGSTTTTPSPTTTTFNPVPTKYDSPSPTTTTFPPPAVTSTASASLTTATFPPATKLTATPFFNHPELSSATSILYSSTSSIIPLIPSSSKPVTSKPSPTTTAIVLAPAITGTSSPTIIRSTTSSDAPWPSESTAHDVMADMTTTPAAAAQATVSPTDGLGPEQFRDDGHPHLDAGTVAGIAIGSSASTILVVALLYFFWRRWKRRDGYVESRDDSGSNSGSNTGMRQYLPRRFTHKSDDRIMNELMAAAYSAENGGRNSYADQMPVNSKGYIREKNRSLEEDEIPIMPAEPEAVAKPGFKRTKRISRWLGRQDSDMLNPMSARASFVSNATGLRTLDLRSMSGWGSDDGMSDYGRYTIPVPRRKPEPRQEEKQEVEMPEPLQVPRDEEPIVQALNVRVQDSTPVAEFPSPEELNLPPPPGAPPSVAGRTENTGRSSGTWNTWGVMQHREQPKGWKEKMRL
ncbi:hypothetical protein AB5N19_11688 [Seiridium cardinale]|uniref:Uncharacterized protein n=1 Tax=Seiridium cardinale TaxID=138064 RepID=A0ABR2XE38_9PEZI